MSFRWHVCQYSCMYSRFLKEAVKVWKESSWEEGNMVYGGEDTTLETQSTQSLKCSWGRDRVVYGIGGPTSGRIQHICYIYVIYVVHNMHGMYEMYMCMYVHVCMHTHTDFWLRISPLFQ